MFRNNTVERQKWDDDYYTRKKTVEVGLMAITFELARVKQGDH